MEVIIGTTEREEKHSPCPTQSCLKIRDNRKKEAYKDVHGFTDELLQCFHHHSTVSYSLFPLCIVQSNVGI